MNLKKILCLTAIVVSFLSLLISQVSASASIAFAPYWWGTGSWPGGYIPYTFAGWGGALWAGNAWAAINPWTGQNNEGAGPGFGYAATWISTGWVWYVGPGPQPGRIHLNTWLENCSIAAPAWIRVRLLVIQLNPLDAWLRTIWFRFVPGAFSSIADGGISLVDAGLFTGAPFQWLTWGFYCSIGIIDAFSPTTGSARVGYSRYDEMMLIAEQLTPEDFIVVTDIPVIHVDPPIGPVCSELTLTVNGTRFAPESTVYIYYDGELVAKGKTDPNGNFIVPFLRHETEKKVHVLRAIDQLENSAETVFVSVGTDKPIADLNYDGRCDMKDIVICILDFGKKEDPPGEASLHVVSMATTAVAAAVVSLILYPLYTKHSNKKKTRNST